MLPEDHNWLSRYNPHTTSSKRLFDEAITHGLNLTQLYSGYEGTINGSAEKIRIPSASERQNNLVTHTVNCILQIVAEETLNEEMLKHSDSLPSTFAALKAKHLIKEGKTQEDFETALKRAQEYCNSTSHGQLKAVALGDDKDSINYSRIRTLFLMKAGVIKNSEDLAPPEEIAEYRQRIADFSRDMDEYNGAVHDYERQVRQRVGDTIALARAIRIYGTQVTSWRDTGGEPPSIPTLQPLPAAPKPPHNIIPVDPRVSYINDHFSSFLSIRETGKKNIERAKEKLAQRMGCSTEGPNLMHADPTKYIYDLSRLTVVPSTLEFAHRFANYITQNIDVVQGEINRTADTPTQELPWSVNERGYLDKKFRLALKGNASDNAAFACEIRIQEKGMRVADVQSHRLYRLSRYILDNENKVDIAKLTPEGIKFIHSEYNDIARWLHSLDNLHSLGNPLKIDAFGYKELVDSQNEDLSPAERERALEGATGKLKAICVKLHDLGQKMHVFAAAASSSEFQKIYLQAAYALEYESGKEVLPEALLENIGTPQMREECRSLAERNTKKRTHSRDRGDDDTTDTRPIMPT